MYAAKNQGGNLEDSLKENLDENLEDSFVDNVVWFDQKAFVNETSDEVASIFSETSDQDFEEKEAFIWQQNSLKASELVLGAKSSDFDKTKLGKNTLQLPEYKKTLRITTFQAQMLIGKLLGDACFYVYTSVSGEKNYALRIEHTEKMAGYIDHQYKIWIDWVLQKPSRIKRKTPTGRTTYNLAFWTVSHPAFKFFADLFYPEGKKVIPENIFDYFTQICLAFWYMDDGALKGKNRANKRLHTEGFPKESVQFLADQLTRFGLKTTINLQTHMYKGTKRQYYVLLLSADADRLFSPFIQTYVPDSMRYKLYSVDIDADWDRFHDVYIKWRPYTKLVNNREWVKDYYEDPECPIIYWEDVRGGEIEYDEIFS